MGNLSFFKTHYNDLTQITEVVMDCVIEEERQLQEFVDIIRMGIHATGRRKENVRIRARQVWDHIS